jgi:hypothetical protein
LKITYKFIVLGLIKRPYSKVVFFFVMLISLNVTKTFAQTTPEDTLKKVSVDTLSTSDNSETLDDPINYSAEDSIVYLASINKVMLYGKAKVKYVDMNLESEFIEIDYTKNLVTAYGKKDSIGKNVGTPIFKDGEQTMEAEKIMYNLKTKKGKIFNALTKQGELLVFGEQIKKDSTNVIYMRDMACIPCKDADARTRFRATKAKIIPNDKIVTGPMYLEIGGVPTPLGLPFGYFPNTKKQHNGILLPTFGNTASQGYNIRNGGFYWGINDKTDLTITSDLYTNGSFAVRTANNYNVLYKSNGAINLAYSQFNIGDKDIPSTFNKQKSYEIKWVHAQDNKNNPTIRFSANVNYVKNQTFNRLNAINSGQFLQNTFQSNIVFTKTFKLSSLNINATHNQNSITKQVSVSFPQLTYNVNRFFPFKRENAVKQNVFDKIGVNYLFEARNTLSGYDSTIFTGDIEKRMAYGIRHALPISTNFNIAKYITVTPALNLNAVMYTKSIRQNFVTDVTTNNGIIKTDTVNGFVGGYDANFTTSFNTKVFFDYAFKNGKVKQIRHLLIPTITYAYRPDFGKEQYGFWKSVQSNTIGGINRYSIFQNTIFGGPAIGAQNAVNVNLSNNIEAKLRKKTDTGFVYNKTTLLQNISASGSYNFAVDSFQMQVFSITARTVVFKNFDIVASSNFDPYSYNKINNRRTSKYEYNETGQIARLTNANFAINTNISSDKLAAAKKLREAPNQSNGAEKGAKNDLDPSAKLPWNIALNYNLGLNNPDNTKLQPTHAINCRADIMPTKYWKVGITTGYDFNRQSLSYTSVNIYRDLKCWEARIDWVPFGARKSYFLTINIKASMLSEFKIPKQSPPINNL